MKIKTYHVYFRQINQTKITVRAKREDTAMYKAIREWKRDYGYPAMLGDIESVEVEDDK